MRGLDPPGHIVPLCVVLLAPGHLVAVPADEGEGEGEGAEHQAPEHQLLQLLPPAVTSNNNR